MKTRKQIAKMLHGLQKQLDMRDWSLVVDGGNPSNDSVAEVSIVSGSRVGRIAVSDDLLEMPEDAIVYVLVHELMHVQLWGLGEQHGRLAKLLRSPQAAAGARESFEAEEESVVDALALAITSLIRPGAGARMKAIMPIIELHFRE